MYTPKDTEADKLEVFKKNEKWQNVIKEFLGAWTLYFDYETGHKGIDNGIEKLLVKDAGLNIQCKTRAGLCVHFGTKVDWQYGASHDVFTELNIYNVTVRPIWFGLRESYVESKVLGLRHKTEAHGIHTIKQYWLDSPELWRAESVNYDRLPDIICAIRLLRERTVDAEDDCAVHEDEMMIHNDYLDGLAEVL